MKAGRDMHHRKFHQLPILILMGVISFGIIPRRDHAADERIAATGAKSQTNRLAKETSPYLLLHAHNPVDWYPWCPEAFEKAKKEDKLIFLSVGYSSCYWCHVMERKVFMNEEIAKTLNRDFVCIKVDREERPDIDEIYMTALQVYFQAIGSPAGGGWPLSIFLTPNGKPVAGGTYFPPEDGEGIQGFPSILERLTDLWKNKRKDMTGNADVLAAETKRLMRPQMSLKPVEVDGKLIDIVYRAMVSSFDSDFGGIDFNANRPDGPKFPTPSKLTFIQQYLERNPNEVVSNLLDLTLMQMACGGIRDHVGGGFHRYSVDRHWDVPHFEKMLYDQAQLAGIYTAAYKETDRTLYKQVAEEIFDFVRREMTSPEGGFYSALDAETNGIEGEYYVWDATEIDRILGKSATPFKEAYRVKDLSDFEHGNVLRLSTRKLPRIDSTTSTTSVTTSDVMEVDEFSASKRKLLEVRDRRKRPLRDEKIMTCWNSLMISSYARAAGPLKHPEYLKTAEKAAEFILNNLKDSEGHLLHTYSAASGSAKLNAYLDDYAFFVDALLALHEATNDPKWLTTARKFQDDQLRMYLDDENGGFFFTSHNHEELIARTKNSYDGVLPAGNSVSARNLLKLATLTKIDSYRDEGRAIVELFAPNIEQAPRAYANLALATMEFLDSKEDDQSDSSKSGAIADNQVITASAKEEKAGNNEKLIILAEQSSGTPKKDELVQGKAYLSTDKLPAGSSCQMVVVLTVKEGWHINANPPSREYLKPTKVSFTSKLETKMTETKYPKGHGFKFAGEDSEVLVYEDKVEIRGTLTVPEKAGGQTDNMEITIEYQACDDNNCLPPKKIKLTGKLDVARKGEKVKPINASLFQPPKTGQKN